MSHNLSRGSKFKFGRFSRRPRPRLNVLGPLIDHNQSTVQLVHKSRCIQGWWIIGAFLLRINRLYTTPCGGTGFLSIRDVALIPVFCLKIMGWGKIPWYNFTCIIIVLSKNHQCEASQEKLLRYGSHIGTSYESHRFP